MANVLGTCCFCLNARNLPQDTVIPLEIADAIAEDAWWGETQFVRPRLLGLEGGEAAPPPRLSRKEWATSVACRECASGWIHDLNSSVAPILVPRIDGRLSEFVLGQRQMILTSRWVVCRVAMLYEQARRRIIELGGAVGRNPWLSVQTGEVPPGVNVEVLFTSSMRLDFLTPGGLIRANAELREIPLELSDSVCVTVLRIGRVAFRISYVNPSMSTAFVSSLRMTPLHSRGFLGYTGNAHDVVPQQYADQPQETLYMARSLLLLDPQDFAHMKRVVVDK